MSEGVSDDGARANQKEINGGMQVINCVRAVEMDMVKN